MPFTNCTGHNHSTHTVHIGRPNTHTLTTGIHEGPDAIMVRERSRVIRDGEVRERRMHAPVYVRKERIERVNYLVLQFA